MSSRDQGKANCLIKNVTEGVDKKDTLTHKPMLPKRDLETEVYVYESTIEERDFELRYKRYKEASRKEKTVIIDECCAVCGYHRKHAISTGNLPCLFLSNGIIY